MNNQTVILPDEVVDDLQINNLFIIQKKHGFKFGIDAVLLSDFAKDCRSKRTLDLCSGTGIVPLLLSAKTDTPDICAVEIQHETAEMSKRSVELNGLSGRIHITEGDLKNADAIYGKAVFDKITCNPPYMKAGSGLKNAEDTKSVSRHEILCDLNDVITAASSLLKPFGHFFMVHRPSRLADIICEMRGGKIEPKKLRFVSPSYGAAPNLVLIEGVKNGNSDLKLLPPLFVYDSGGNYTDEVKGIYGFM